MRSFNFSVLFYLFFFFEPSSSCSLFYANSTINKTEPNARAFAYTDRRLKSNNIKTVNIFAFFTKSFKRPFLMNRNFNSLIKFTCAPGQLNRIFAHHMLDYRFKFSLILRIPITAYKLPYRISLKKRKNPVFEQMSYA